MTSDDLLAIFFVECEESLAAAENGLAACRDGSHDDETINAVFRAVHSIKGGAGAFGFAALQAFTHGFETLLSDVREGAVALDEPMVSLLLRALDTLSDHVTVARDGGEAPADEALLGELDRARAGSRPADAPQPGPVAELPPANADDAAQAEVEVDLDSLLDELAGPPPAPAPADWTLGLRPHGEAMANGGEPLLLLRELEGLGGRCLHCDCQSVPALDAFDPDEGYLGWSFALPGTVTHDQVRDLFDFFSDDIGLAFGAEAGIPAPRPLPFKAPAPQPGAPDPRETRAAAGEAPKSAPPPSAAAVQSIRIDLIKLDRLIDTVGELVIAQAMLAQHLGSQIGETNEALALLEGLTRDIQESAMAIRAQPISSVFNRVPRMLRELATSTGKVVNLETQGEGTELDKTVIERLGEPMTHLIRNAVDHGIESADERIAAGKPAEGTLHLSAEQRSGRIAIRIRDDGRGIDRARVLAKAIERGILGAEAQPTDEEIDALIFAPGFSTAKTVSNISGRGVGLDVVRQNVKDLGGRITIESEPGRGTTFTLTLPLTLAISDGMIVKVGDQTLVVPLTHVVESLRPGPGEIQGLGVARQMLNMRGSFIPVVPVASLVGARGAAQSASEGVLIVVDTESAGQAALLVDEICDQRQFVIKSLDDHYRAMKSVSGATILGDGRVALILDVDGLVAGHCTAAAARAAA